MELVHCNREPILSVDIRSDEQTMGIMGCLILALAEWKCPQVAPFVLPGCRGNQTRIIFGVSCCLVSPFTVKPKTDNPGQPIWGQDVLAVTPHTAGKFKDVSCCVGNSTRVLTPPICWAGRGKQMGVL